MRGVALVLFALLIRALTSCHESLRQGLLVDEALLLEKGMGFCTNECRDTNCWCSGPEQGEMFCVEVHQVKLLFLYQVFSECPRLCVCIFASRNCQASSCYLTSDPVKAVCLPMGLHLSGCVCISFFCLCPKLRKALVNQDAQLSAWLIRCTASSSAGILFTGQQCIKMTMQFQRMTEHRLLVGAVCGFTASGMSCLTHEFMLSLKLSDRTENRRRKDVPWLMMFYKTLSTSVCVCAALLYGCTCVPKRTSVMYGNINCVANKTRKYDAHTRCLRPHFLEYKKVVCKINIFSKQMNRSQSAERCIKKPHAFKSTTCQKEISSRLLKYYTVTTILGTGRVRIIRSVSLCQFCNTAANNISNDHPGCPTNRRAHHSKLSFVLLLTVPSCSFISLHVTLQRSGSACTVFGISFVLSISCVLGKKIRGDANGGKVRTILRAHTLWGPPDICFISSDIPSSNVIEIIS